MDKARINVQDQVLNVARKERIAVEIRLLGGEQLRGHIQSFDGYCILLKAEDGREIMIYKHALATLIPLEPLPLSRREPVREEE